MRGRSQLGLLVLGAFVCACTLPPRGADFGQAPQFRRPHQGPPGGDGMAPGQWRGNEPSAPTSWTEIASTSAPARVQSSATTVQLEPAHGQRVPGFQIRYEPAGAALEPVRAALRSEGWFEQVVDVLNRRVRMPRSVVVHLARCGTANAFYEPKSGRIIVCYEFVAHIARAMAQHVRGEEPLAAAVVGTTFFAFFHELGHALRHQLDLAVVGREEDAVDQLATLVLLSSGELGLHAAIAGANWFLLAGAGGDERMAYWDEHSLDQQRFYNIICLIYGSNPTRRSTLQASLPQARSRRCPEEFARVSAAWNKLLDPHVRGVGTSLFAWHDDAAADPGPADEASCQRVADRLADLTSDHQRKRLENLAVQQRAIAERALESELLLLRLSIIDRCHDERWDHARRMCVVRSLSDEQALRCTRR